MKRAAGFTLIELVIVIVILGILGAVAAPRFLNLQGDAYGANVNALEGSVKSAITLANTKAILGGWDAETTATGHEVEGTQVKFIHGFPTATADGIINMLQDSSDFTDAGNTNYNYDAVATAGTLLIFPKARDAFKDNCGIKYTQATATSPAKVESDTTKC